jgi:Peptidase MA superfamily
MGVLIRAAAAAAVALVAVAIGASPARAVDEFGEISADSTYDREIRFEVTFTGRDPDRLELLLRTPGSDASFVVPVDPDDGEAEYVWNVGVDYVTPNTLVTYQWRAVDGDEVTLSDEGTIRYEDDRERLDWQTAQLGETTVHWYGDAETQALRFGELAAVGVEQGEALLGTELAGPVDVFVYEEQEDFFSALGPGAREWTGAAAFSDIRTIFMWLGGGDAAYLETAMVHEVTHIVFADATDNPYHEPATWINEGIAVWAEAGDGGDATSFVRDQAANGGLFAFEAISQRFPIGDLGGSLSYAQGASMIDFIVDQHGREAIARMTAAYRDGASDEEALEAATGIAADELYAAYYAQFGIEAPTPVEPEPIPASDVDRPAAGEVDPGGVEGGPEIAPGEPAPGESAAADGVDAWVVFIAIAVGALVVAALAVLVARRAARSATR